MDTSIIIFEQCGENRHSLQVRGTPESVVGALRNQWAQLDVQMNPEGEAKWVWVNAANVLYVEPAT